MGEEFRVKHLIEKLQQCDPNAIVWGRVDLPNDTYIGSIAAYEIAVDNPKDPTIRFAVILG